MTEPLPLSDETLPSLVRGNVKIEWTNLNEGNDGDYDPADPDDVNLLRFDVSRLENGEWLPVDDGSYCTQMPASTPTETLEAALVLMMNEIHGEIDSFGKAKRRCEQLSWISPESVAKGSLQTDANC